MFTLIKNGELFIKQNFEKADLLFGGKKILHIGALEEKALAQLKIETRTIDVQGCYVFPGFIDSQSCLVGGSGEEGFLSQPPRIAIEECVRGGFTTVVGSIGVDTSTKTMSN